MPRHLRVPVATYIQLRSITKIRAVSGVNTPYALVADGDAVRIPGDILQSLVHAAYRARCSAGADGMTGCCPMCAAWPSSPYAGTSLRQRP